MARSEGDPRVLFVMNLVLSGLFSLFVFWALSLLDVSTFAWEKVAVGTLLLMAITYVVTRR